MENRWKKARAVDAIESSRKRRYVRTKPLSELKDGRNEGWRRGRGRPTSNHNLVLCRVVCRGSEEAVGNEFVRFAGLSCLRVSACVYKESAGIFSRLKFMVRIRERRYAGLPTCIRLIYSTSETVDEPHAKPAQVGQGESLEERYTVEWP